MARLLENNWNKIHQGEIVVEFSDEEFTRVEHDQEDLPGKLLRAI